VLVEEMRAEKAELFARVVDLRKAGVHRRSLFDYAFTTDGVCARIGEVQARVGQNVTF